jgi:hypothetical protein
MIGIIHARNSNNYSAVVECLQEKEMPHETTEHFIVFEYKGYPADIVKNAGPEPLALAIRKPLRDVIKAVRKVEKEGSGDLFEKLNYRLSKL